MRTLLFNIVLLLLFAGNATAVYKLITARDSFLLKFPKITSSGYQLLIIIPFVNLVALAGIWCWQTWAAWLAIGCCVAVIFCDIYFDIRYHLFVAIPSTVILLFFIVRYWNQFK